jgi:hypothetical protein
MSSASNEVIPTTRRGGFFDQTDCRDRNNADAACSATSDDKYPDLPCQPEIRADYGIPRMTSKNRQTPYPPCPCLDGWLCNGARGLGHGLGRARAIHLDRRLSGHRASAS